MKRAALILLGLAALIPLRAGASGATFVAASANPGASFSAAADFNTVSVAMTDPGALLHGTISLSATAASDRGIANVTFQTSPAGANTWTNACTATAAPYTCAFDTASVADGMRDIRAVATDSAGYSRTASVTSRRVDNVAPTTSLTDPGAVLTGTKTLSATAADAGSGLASIKLQYRTSGGSTWTDVCSATSCPLNTATLADGLYDLRSLATDNAGNTNTSVVSSRRVDNTAPTVAVSGLAGYVRGPITFNATTGDGNGAGVTSVKYQTRPNGGSTWTDACTGATSCSFATTGLTDGLYDVRAIATDGAALTTTSATVGTRVDNAAPTASLTAPAATVSGSVTLNATATDGGAGVASVQFQSSPAGTSTWTTFCTDTTSTFSCAWNTTTLTDGLYDLRVVATDNAGNTVNSTTVANRRVDNAGPALTFSNPGTLLRGTVSLTATSTDGVGVTNVTFQHRVSPSGSWTNSCTPDTATPYACSLNTTTLASGQTYDFRATSVDTLGHTSTSPTYTATVDNTAPTGTNVQAVNGGTIRKMDAGDTLTFTYSEAMAPGSILSGWDGSAVAVTVRVADSASNDLLSVWNGGDTTKLNLTGTTDLQLKANRTAATLKFSATMTMTGSSVVITLGSATVGTAVQAFTSTPMVWTPSASATDLAGNACATTAVTETGTDIDF